ncbi:superinfection immunity protein [Salicibibacter cibarius]|uniref:Superinfection immunity protein n=1 Tax=Salicibibacter cibarius TaxID=2743000 RepID=A0A7T6Z7A3_9BACI|nr:superinfection immunity protein [Salicibibacter cibarius]
MIYIAVIVGLCFLPTIIAVTRKKRSSGAIFICNLIVGGLYLFVMGFIGIIGWIILIIWSLLSESEF